MYFLPNYRFIFSTIYFRNVVVHRNIRYFQTYTYHIHWCLDINRDDGWLCVLSFDQIAQYKLNLLGNGLTVLSMSLYEARSSLQTGKPKSSLSTCARSWFLSKVTLANLSYKTRKITENSLTIRKTLHHFTLAMHICIRSEHWQLTIQILQR